ncbi:MAG: Gldg family protein [Planctomycetes bacterium]|nr:Gldg family protein [Planctomycetota bacterium]
MNHYQRSILGTILILVITVCVAGLLNRWTESFGRIDLTERSIYTLTDGTRSILRKVGQPLTMKFFYSKSYIDETGNPQLRAINNLYYYVRDLLRSYERASGGRLKLEEYDPAAFSPEEEEADRLGVTRLPTQGQAGLYFGMAITTESGRTQAIPVFDARRQSMIEYQITEAIERITSETKTKLGVMSSLDVAGGDMNDFQRMMAARQGRQVAEPWGNVEVLKRFYDVSNVATDVTEIDPELDYLVLIHPKELSDQTLYAIDQFVMRGGKLICFVDPHAPFADPAPRDPNNPFGGPAGHEDSSNLNRLLQAWGVKVDPQQYVADFGLALPINSQRGPTPLGTFLALNTPGEDGVAQGVNPDDPVTQGLSQRLVMYFPGAVQAATGSASDVNITPLLMTTRDGRMFTADRYKIVNMMGGMPNPDTINGLAGDVAATGPLTLAARVTGQLHSAFPDGAPKAEGEDADKPADGEEKPEDGEQKPTDEGQPGDESKPGEGEEAATPDAASKHRAMTVQPNSIIVVADVDMICDALSFQRAMGGLLLPTTGNYEFVLNVVDNLSGSSDLMSVRSRGNFERPFTVVDRIEREADAELRKKVEEINKQIEAFDKQLQEMRQQATEQNVALLQRDALDERRKLETSKREKQRELNDLQRQREDRIDALESRLVFYNVVGVPGVILLIGLVLWAVQALRRLSITGGAR